MREIHIDAYAKVNWDLHVLGKRPDGFHEVDTVMVSIGLADRLTFKQDEQLSLTCSDPDLPCGESNLVIKAALALAKAAGMEPRARIHLDKRIPSGGGLGGGSSDAAATLQALNQLWQLDWSKEQLSNIAAGLGSDVPFFLWHGWCRCKGRGELVEPLFQADRPPPVRLWLIIPPYAASTPSVYKKLGASALDATAKHRILTEIEQNVKVEIGRLVNRKVCKYSGINDLQPAAHRVEPRLEELARHLEEHFPGRWRMSGSGSVHFVIPEAGMELVQTQNGLNTFKDPLRIAETATRSA